MVESPRNSMFLLAGKWYLAIDVLITLFPFSFFSPGALPKAIHGADPLSAESGGGLFVTRYSLLAIRSLQKASCEMLGLRCTAKTRRRA